MDIQINGKIVGTTLSPSEVEGKLMQLANELGGVWTETVQPG